MKNAQVQLELFPNLVYCPKCGKPYFSLVKVYINVKKFQCNNCDIYFFQKSEQLKIKEKPGSYFRPSYMVR